MVDVNDRKELEKFLLTLPHQARVSFAARAALRVAPFCFTERFHIDNRFDGTVFLLACLRVNLVPGVASIWQSSDPSEIYAAAYSADFARSHLSADSAARSADSAAAAALSTNRSLLSSMRPDLSAALSTDAALRSTNFSNAGSLAALSSDSTAIPKGPLSLFATPLWPAQVPEEVSEAIEGFEETAPGTPWAFWARWYRGMLDGKPLDWDLQRRVALIDNAIWKAGPEAVAQEIERIERLFDLEREIAALKNMLPPRSALSSTSLIGDNGGPPLDDGIQRAVRYDVVLAWDQIEELEAEIAKPEPSPGKLKKIAQTLWDISVRIASYCGGKIDLALTEASKEAGKAAVKWGARVGAASMAAQNEGIQQVFKAIWAFVKTLPPG